MANNKRLEKRNSTKPNGSKYVPQIILPCLWGGILGLRLVADAIWGDPASPPSPVLDVNRCRVDRIRGVAAYEAQRQMSRGLEVSDVPRARHR